MRVTTRPPGRPAFAQEILVGLPPDDVTVVKWLKKHYVDVYDITGRPGGTEQAIQRALRVANTSELRSRRQ